MKYAVFFCIGHAIVNSLGASACPALQTFLSHILDRKNRFFLLSCEKIFFFRVAAASAEMLEEIFQKKVVISPHLDTLILFCLYFVVVKISLGIHGARRNLGVLLCHEVKQQLLGGMARAM